MIHNKHLRVTHILLLFGAFAAQHTTAMDDATCMNMQLESMNVYFLCYDEAMITKKPKLGVKICRRTMLDYLRQLRKTSCAVNERPKKIVKRAGLCAKGETAPLESYISTFAKCQQAVADVFYAVAEPKDGPLDPITQSPEENPVEVVSESPPRHFHYVCGGKEYTCMSTDGDCPPKACDDDEMEPILEDGNERYLRGAFRFAA